MPDTPQLLEPYIVRSKIRIPRIRPQLIIRQALIDRLNQGEWRKLSLVCSQPGSGKTTLLYAWTSQLGEPVAWFTLDANDNAIDRFLAHLAAAVNAAVPGAGGPALALLGSSQLLDAKTLIGSLINELDQQETSLYLILDDYHVIRQPAVHEAVNFLLENIPETLHLIIASRSDPPLPLARLRAQDQVTELRTNDLRFSIKEGADFLKEIMSLDLSQEDSSALVTQTEGWVTGLQLAALAIQSAPMTRGSNPSRLIKSLSSSNRYILDYLTEEVLRYQPEDIQAFLLNTSILERMNPALCQAITGRTDCGPLLKKLEQSHLFIIPIDEEDEWYRYHTLFADLLRFQFEQAQPEEARALRRKAAQWLENNDLNIEAINQYLNLKDFEQAALLAQKEGEALLNRGQAALFMGWFKNLPEEVFRAMPRLHLVYCFGLLSIGKFWMIEEALQALEKLAPDEETNSELWGEVAGVRAITSMTSGNFDEAILQSHKAIARLPETVPLRSSILIGLGVALNFRGRLAEACQAFEDSATAALFFKQYSVALTALYNLGTTQIIQASLHQAQRTFQRLIDTEKSLPERSPTVGMAYMGLAELAYEWNRLDQALSFSQKSIGLVDAWGNIEIRGMARLFLAINFAALGNMEDAEFAFDQIEELLKNENYIADQSGLLRSRQVEYFLQTGRLKQAIQMIAGLPAIHAKPEPIQVPMEIARLKTMLAQAAPNRNAGLYRQVLAAVGYVQQAATEYGQVTLSIEATMARVLALQGLGQDSAALENLETALEQAEREGFIRRFLGFGQPVAGVLRKAAATSLHKEYIQLLLDAFDADNKTFPTGAGQIQVKTSPNEKSAPDELVEPLSERELEVLHLVQEGLSNQEIATRLVIAQGTVKRHLHNILEKLGVSTRSQAISAARRMQL